MKQRRASRRAMLLLELVAMIMIGVVMLSLLARMIVNHLEFQRLSRLHRDSYRIGNAAKLTIPHDQLEHQILIFGQARRARERGASARRVR